MRLFIFLSFFLCSCAAGESAPAGVLTPQKMEAVLYDLINADEFVDFSSIQDSSFRKFSKRSALYDSISGIHSVTKEVFQKSWQYYQTRPDLLKEIFSSLYLKTDTTAMKKDSVIKKLPVKPIVKTQ